MSTMQRVAFLSDTPGKSRLSGRHTLVVGAGTRDYGFADAPVGIGRAIAVVAGREGSEVACVDIDRGAAESTSTVIRHAGGAAHTVVADVSRPDGCASLVKESVDAMGALDGIVFNVATVDPENTFELTTAADWDRVMAINLRSAFLITQAALPHLRDGSSLVYISSVRGIRAGSVSPVYDASKAGVVNLAASAALKLGVRNIRANVVSPGPVDTAMSRSFRLRRRLASAETSSAAPLARRGTAWDIAYAVLYLLSDESAYVTGQNLQVDGGVLLPTAV